MAKILVPKYVELTDKHTHVVRVMIIDTTGIPLGTGSERFLSLDPIRLDPTQVFLASQAATFHALKQALR